MKLREVFFKLVLTLNRFFLWWWCFDSKPILFMVATIIWGNRKFCSLPSTVKAEARFRVKTKIRPEANISEQFQPTLLMWKNTLFHDCGIWGVGEARLPVCRVLVLTHNFEVWRPVIIWLLVFVIWGLWFQRGLWQNCESKQVVRFDSKPSRHFAISLTSFFQCLGNSGVQIICKFMFIFIYIILRFNGG